MVIGRRSHIGLSQRAAPRTLKVTQTTATLHSDKAAGERTAVPQRVETKLVRELNPQGYHVLLISVVVANARDFHVLAIAKVPSPARQARAVMAAVPADTCALSLPPLSPGGTDGDTGKSK
jgi:hypothetical protein